MAAAELELDRLEMSEIKTIGEKARVEKTSLLISDRPEKDDDRSRERELEELLYSSGYGFFHVLLILVTGLATAADAVEIFGVSFVVPIAEKDLDLTTATKGYLDASIFIGMLIGSYLWGSLADVFGRKKTLITAMVINGVCGFTSAFSPNFYVFIIFRFASGIGVGGSQPIVFSYISEFFSEKQRGPIIIMLASCWQPGIIFTAFLAWGMLGIEGAYDGISFYIGSLHFVNWRLFIIICTFPAFLSSISLFFMTETPAFLFHTGKNQEFNKVLKKILKVNSLCLCCWCVKPTTDTVPLLSSQEDGLNEDPSVSPNSESGIINPPPNEGCCTRLNYFIFSKFMKIILTTAKIFKLNYIRATSLLLIIWFTQSFGYPKQLLVGIVLYQTLLSFSYRSPMTSAIEILKATAGVHK